ncbi:MAG: PIN domain-containing protein [Bryobacteraceae bacterium]|jgi:predicted nucleic acid-binding protein
MGLILDSTFLIAAERQGKSVLQILEQIEAAFGAVDVGISVIAVAELVHGAYRAQDEARKQRRLRFIERLSTDVPVYPVTLGIARMVGRMEGELAGQGVSVAFEDLAIGATALALGFDVATANLRHFQSIPELKVVAI